MDQTGIRAEQPQENDIASSETRQTYCQHLVNSLITPHLDTSKSDLNSTLLRTFGEVLTNVENRVKAIFTRCIQAGQTTAAEPERCVEEFQRCLHYMEEYLSTCFQNRNVNYLYGKMEMEEPTPSGPKWKSAQRAMARIKKQLHEELDVKNSAILEGLVQHKLVSDWERDSILARATPRAKAEELVRTVMPRLDQHRLREQFLPLLETDHKHLAEGLTIALEEEEEEETGGPEVKCCVCRFHAEVEVKRLARQLSEVVSPSLESDLFNPALSNASKMQRLKEEVRPDLVIQSLREPYPALHQQFCSTRVTALECFCARLREEQASDVLDNPRACSLTEDGDVGCMSDLESMLGDVDLRARAYHLGSKTRGICLIISNMAYSQSSGLPNRAGSDYDMKNLREFFDQLHFLIVIYEDLTANDILKQLKEIAGGDHSSYDCFVCFILSHGDGDQLYGVDGSNLPVKDVIATFHACNCITLAGKPKLFFIQASRGSIFPTALVPKSAEEGICAEDADIFIGFPSTKDHCSFRNPTQGAWYINALIEVLAKYGEQYDFQSCMTRVTQLVGSRVPHVRRGDGRQLCQIPESVSTLRKPLFLSRSLVVTKPAPEFDTKVEPGDSAK